MLKMKPMVPLSFKIHLARDRVRSAKITSVCLSRLRLLLVFDYFLTVVAVSKKLNASENSAYFGVTGTLPPPPEFHRVEEPIPSGDFYPANGKPHPS